MSKKIIRKPIGKTTSVTLNKNYLEVTGKFSGKLGIVMELCKRAGFSFEDSLTMYSIMQLVSSGITIRQVRQIFKNRHESK